MKTTFKEITGADATAARTLKRTGMNRTTIVAVAFWAAVCATPAATFAQAIQRSEGIASSDVLSQISMFSYRDGKKSDLFLHGTPVAENAQGTARVEYQKGNAQISAKVKNL